MSKIEPIDRRHFLARTALLPALDFLRLDPHISIGSCVIGLEDARSSGLDGVEVNAGKPSDRLDIADPEVIARYREQMRRTGLKIPSLMMSLFNECPLASDPRAPQWIDQAITAARALDARVILLAFFGPGDLLDDQGQIKSVEVNRVIQILKAAAPRAAENGVILAIENYLSARQNLRILNAINHPSVQIYYDIYNTGVTRKHDVPAEIALLGHRIAQFHFKNGPDYLDAGNIDFNPIARAIQHIGYNKWIILETANPSGDPVADARRNADFTRRLFP
jgi:sugar phosphate isomerase/epimerase